MTARSARIASIVWTAILGLAWSGMLITAWLALPYGWIIVASALAIWSVLAAARLDTYANRLAYREELAAVPTTYRAPEPRT